MEYNKEYCKEWYLKNKEHKKEYNKEYYQQNRSKIRKEQKDYYRRTKGYILTKKSEQRKYKREQTLFNNWKNSLEEKLK